jgi:hypothetical protein
MNRLTTLAAALVATTVATQAISLNYQVGGGSTVVANTADPGLALGTHVPSSLSSIAFTLDDGQSTTFNFFKIWAAETSVSSDDTVPKNITATLDFSVPDVDAAVYGLTFGAQLNFIQDAAYLTWNAPAVVTLADRVFEVELSDLEFAKGHIVDWDLTDKKSWVTATVTQISSRTGEVPNSVPDGGATLVMLALGIAGLSCVRRQAR